MPLTLPLMRGGGLHFRVTLCWRGLRTAHIHRPLTTYFLGAKISLFSESTKLFLPFSAVFLAKTVKSLPLFEDFLSERRKLKKFCVFLQRY